MIRKRRKTNKLFNLINVLLAVVIVVSLLILLTTVITPRGQVPNIAGVSVFIVLTGSMEPEIATDSLIATVKTPPEELKIGDIISFYFTVSGETAVNTHRIIEITEKDGVYSFRTRGDANQSEDPNEVSQTQLIGRVVFSSYFIGRVISFLRQKYVFMALILIPLAVVIVVYIVKLFKITREEIRIADKEIEEEQTRLNAEKASRRESDRDRKK